MEKKKEKEGVCLRARFKLIFVCLLVCVLALSLAACAPAPAVETAPPAPVQSEAPAVPTEQIPASSAPVFFDDSDPVVSGDIPAMQPDEETTLTYVVGEEAVTVPALKHYTLHGYSIVYDTENYVCNAFTEGDSYWACEGNYLAVNLIFGMPLEDVLAGLRLQENIAMEPETVTVGAGGYTAQTVHLTTPSGLYRQFWAMDCGGDVLLVEQSFDTFSDNAAVYHASQLAMLDSLTILY